LNTAAYSKARKRVPLALTQRFFEASRIEQPRNTYTHWRDLEVFMADGTYVQMQDTPSIRADFEVKSKTKPALGFPQGLIEVILHRGSGQLHSFRLVNRHVSELAVFYEMMDELPPKSLLLLDDLYNCYEIIAKARRLGIELIVPGKRKRNCELIETWGHGDELVQIKTPKNRSKWLLNNEPPNKFQLRRIKCLSPDGNEYTLYSTLTDKTVSKEEIQLLYTSRWDIEISVREVKTIMDINVLRSKTPEMALKELTVSLATYNLIRKIIYASIKDLPFPPKGDFIHEFYTNHKALLIDKKGRVYSRWSTGRPRTGETDKSTATTKTKTQQEV
jgi:hypothetical protein